jgi:hypothetical protein
MLTQGVLLGASAASFLQPLAQERQTKRSFALQRKTVKLKQQACEMGQIATFMA